MEARRRLLMMLEKSEGVGIFTKGYEAVLTPQSTKLFTITHNLGILPRLVSIEADMDSIQTTNYIIMMLIDNNVYGLQDDKTGVALGKYHYNSNDSYSATRLPIASYEATETAIVIPAGAVFNSIRSPWDISASYSVRIWG